MYSLRKVLAGWIFAAKRELELAVQSTESVSTAAMAPEFQGCPTRGIYRANMRQLFPFPEGLPKLLRDAGVVLANDDITMGQAETAHRAHAQKAVAWGEQAM